MSKCESLKPIVDKDSRVLILGSMPGRKSLELQQYYAHPQNRFWGMLSVLLREDEPLRYEDKKNMLLRHHIALWDTLSFCERDGSLDSAIKNEQPNAVCEFLEMYLQITAVFCNGGKAAAAFKKYFAGKLSKNTAVFFLHSTSPANACMNLDALANEWQLILNYLL